MQDITLLSELLPRTAARTPDAVAVESSTGSPALTYAQLFSSSQRGAAALRAIGLGPGSRVVIAMDGSVDWAIAFWSVVQAGLVAVPVPGINIPKPIGGAGLVRLVCNTHPWMRGFVIVTDDTAAVTSADGTFTLRDVPAGTYELRIWHESLKGAAQKVTVAAGQTATVNFDLE